MNFGPRMLFRNMLWVLIVLLVIGQIGVGRAAPEPIFPVDTLIYQSADSQTPTPFLVSPGEPMPRSVQIAQGTGVLIMHFPGQFGACTATDFQIHAKPFVVTAGHCYDSKASSTDLILALSAPVYGRATVIAHLQLIKDFSTDGDDVSVWEGIGPQDTMTLLDHAIQYPEGKYELQPDSILDCRQLKILNGRDGSIFVAALPMRGMTGQQFAMPLRDEWSSVWSFSADAWPGSSGSVCFDSNGHPAGVVVGILATGVIVPEGDGYYHDSAIPQLPTFIEGSEALDKVIAAVTSDRKPVTPVVVPRFQNEDTWTSMEVKLWEAAYVKNEEYYLFSSPIYPGFYILSTSSVVIGIYITPEFTADLEKVLARGKLQDLGPYVSRWKTQNILSK